MVFSSISFLFLYFPVVFGVYLILPNIKWKNAFLTVASLLFYAWGEPVYVFLMLISVAINWLIGLQIEKNREKQDQLLALAIIINIAILFYFKYCGFLVELINYLPKVELEVPSISLPIGISFFIFQSLSYVFDVKRAETEAQKSYTDLLLYVALFPQLIAGPIVKYHDIAEQIKKRSTSLERIAPGIRRFIIGLSKKVLISNQMALVADTIFAVEPSELNIISTWIGAIAYVLQLYFDFSGYSDMAIAIGSMFGFDFKENFNYPLTATSIKDFWRRWHISLSTWFREYLYIPLGGNRKGQRRTYINQFAVFLATGLWHGANMTFVLWGLFHGLFLVLETCGMIKIDKIKSKSIKRLYTLLIVTLLFVLFRADTLSYGVEYIKTMFVGFDFDASKHFVATQFMTTHFMLISVIAVITATDILRKIQTHLKKANTLVLLNKNQLEVLTYIVTIMLFMLNVLSLAANTYNPFIYFRF